MAIEARTRSVRQPEGCVARILLAAAWQVSVGLPGPLRPVPASPRIGGDPVGGARGWRGQFRRRSRHCPMWPLNLCDGAVCTARGTCGDGKDLQGRPPHAKPRVLIDGGHRGVAG
jgi:hypothetical protein